MALINGLFVRTIHIENLYKIGASPKWARKKIKMGRYGPVKRCFGPIWTRVLCSWADIDPF